MKRRNPVYAIIPILIVLFASCAPGTSGGTGTLSLNLTDAPIDDPSVSGVYITVNGIAFNRNGEWETAESFDGPRTVNLLELTGGVVELMGSFELPAGRYTQVRFFLDIPEVSSDQPSNPGCYIVFTDPATSDVTTEALFVPSGAQSGYKAVTKEGFDVPVNGEVKVTVDFDVRRAVLESGGGRYILKPVLRIVVDDQAGRIAGAVNGIEAAKSVGIFVYEDGTYVESEAEDPAVDATTGESDSRFPNAVTSVNIEASETAELPSYVLAFLAEGAYDLVVTQYDGATFEQVLGFIPDVSVTSELTTRQDIDLSAGLSTTY